MKFLMDIYVFCKIKIKNNCSRINNFKKQKRTFVHVFDLNLVLGAFY